MALRQRTKSADRSRVMDNQDTLGPCRLATRCDLSDGSTPRRASTSGIETMLVIATPVGGPPMGRGAQPVPLARGSP